MKRGDPNTCRAPALGTGTYFDFLGDLSDPRRCGHGRMCRVARVAWVARADGWIWYSSRLRGAVCYPVPCRAGGFARCLTCIGPHTGGVTRIKEAGPLLPFFWRSVTIQHSVVEVAKPASGVKYPCPLRIAGQSCDMATGQAVKAAKCCIPSSKSLDLSFGLHRRQIMP